MRFTTEKLKNSFGQNVYSWARLVVIAGSGQIVVQALGLLSGILIIRLLPTKEYAFYTLSNAMLATMSVLGDAGIGSGIMSEGGKVWENKEELGKVLTTGLRMRKMFAIFSLIVALPILIYLLAHQGGDMLTIVLIIVTLIPSFFAALSDSLLEVILKLHQDIKTLQVNQVLVAVLRFFMTALPLFFLPYTFIALLGNGLPRIFGNIKLRRIAFNFATEGQPEDPIVRRRILKVVRNTLPGTIYFCISGQLTIWLISIFGNTSSIAQIGALGRLSSLLTVFSIVFLTLISPRFARLRVNKALLLSRFVQIIGLLTILIILILLIVYLFPSVFLWILGPQYQTLGNSLFLSMLGGCLALFYGCIYGLSSSRGWVINPIFSIPINVATVISGIILFDVSTINGILYLNILTWAVQIIMLTFYTSRRIIGLAM